MTNKRIIKVLILLSLMYLSLIGYLTYMQIFQSEKLDENPYNQRIWDTENITKRGNIYDANGVLLAESVDTVRIYPYKGMYSHIIGYNSRMYGRINLESSYNDLLLAKSELHDVLGTTGSEYGHDITLTIDHDIQKLAYEELGDNKGSVIAINPKTGEIIAMVSKPDFDPNEEKLASEWVELTEDEDSPFLARATSGLYAPGSTFKLLTALSAVENNLEDMTFSDKGKVKIGGTEFENHNGRAYGSINLKRGFAVSSNVVFCTLGDKLGGNNLYDVATRFGFNKSFDFDIEYKQSYFPANVTASDKEAAIAIGQDDVLSTPLQMAMVTCGIANDGVIMKPYIVDRVVSHNGEIIKKSSPYALYNSASYMDTKEVVDMMVETVESGTGTNAKIYGIDVAGKTGTAENEHTDFSENMQHTWFVSFAPAYDPEIVVVVMMENSGGTGGGNCAPIAREIMKKYLKK